MKIKKEYIILFSIVVVLVAYIAFEQKGKIHYELPEFENCMKSDISKLVIEQGKVIVHIVKEDAKWLIKPYNYLADDLKVDEMIKSCSRMKLTSMVSESKNYALYDLDPGHRIRLTAFKGSEVIRQIDIGKATSSYRHTFVKLPDDDRVFQAADDLRQQFNNAVSEARDKTVLKFDKENIQKVHLFNGEKSMILVKSTLSAAEQTSEAKQNLKKVKTVWKNEEGKKVKKAVLDNLLETLSDLSCDNYVGDDVKKGMGKLSYRVILSGSRDYTISIFGKSDEKYSASSSENKYPFLLSEYMTKKIMVSFADLEEK